MMDWVGITTLITAIGAVVIGIINAIRTPRLVQKVEDRVVEVSDRVNGRLSELLRTVEEKAMAEGYKKGRKEADAVAVRCAAASGESPPCPPT